MDDQASKKDDQAFQKAWDPLALPGGPITRGRLKKFKEALQGIMEINYDVPNPKVEGGGKVNVIQVAKDYLNGTSQRVGRG